MTESSTNTQQAEAARTETISILENLTEKADEFGLPKPPETLEQYHRKLVENTFEVLVVGEAKRGKSTFVNALVGRDVLPTDLQVVAGQVFNVRSAERETYRLRFEDGSVRDVTLEDLPRYGSQVLGDARLNPRLNQIIRWIEVDAPAPRFLAEGMRLLDTPGFGAVSLPRAAEIIYRFMPEADAVIFMLDSNQPILETERRFIESILDVTPHIFFIQTKIDLHHEKDWQDVQRRNQELLQEKFEGRLAGTNVWPVSSSLLLQAASGGEDAEEDLEDSRYPELEPALRAFLFRVTVRDRFAEALMVAQRYRARVRLALSRRLAGLVEDKRKHEEMRRRAVARRQQFETDWGPEGQKRKELVESVRGAAEQGKQSLAEALQPGGRIALAQEKEIEALVSLEEVWQLKEAMIDEVISEAAREWYGISELIQKRCAELLAPFWEAAESLLVPEQEVVLSESVIENLKESGHEFLTNSTKQTLVAVTLGIDRHYYLKEGRLLPIRSATVALGALWALKRPRASTPTPPEIRGARSWLRRRLAEVLEEAHNHFIGVASSSDNQNSRADEFFQALEHAALDKVQTVFEQKLEEAEAEDDRLREVEDLDERQREAAIEETKRQLAQWDDIGKAIEDMSQRLAALDQQPAVTREPRENQRDGG